MIYCCHYWRISTNEYQYPGEIHLNRLLHRATMAMVLRDVRIGPMAICGILLT